MDSFNECISRVGDRVHSIRKSRKMSLQDVATEANMSKTHIWDIEKGNSPNMTVRTLVKLSIALKTTPSDLLNFDLIDSILTDREIQIALAARKIYQNPSPNSP